MAKRSVDQGPGEPYGRATAGPEEPGAEFYAAQGRAMEERLRRHLDERLSGLAGSFRGGGGTAGDRGWMRWRPEIYAGVLLVLLVLFTWPPAFLGGEGEGDPDESEIAGDVSGRAGELPAAPAGDSVEVPADPAAAWTAFVADHRAELAAWARAVAEARGLADDEVSDVQKRSFGSMAETLGGGGALSEAQHGYLRTGLFEYLYGRWQVRRTGQAPPGFVVNQQFSGYDLNALRELARALGLPADLGLTDPPGNLALQYLVVTRTLAREEPPAA